jgi:hypothetical protein
MKFCQPHWDELRQQVKSHGVWDLVATSGEEVVSQVVDELKGVPTTLERYDPLMAAHNMIVSRAIECGGLYLLTGDYCPLCELTKNSSVEVARSWICGASKAAADYATTLPRQADNA